MNYFNHYSVLKNECMEYLNINSSVDNSQKYYADLTFGGGGHSFEMLYRNKDLKLFSTDQDPDALKNGYARIAAEKMESRIQLIDSNFVHFKKFATENLQEVIKAGGFDGILMDIGVSTHHFDEGERGFSFRFDGPLDMRMNNRDGLLSAKDIINQYSEFELAKIFEEYGEEKLSRKIARKICEEREHKAIVTTKELENIIFHTYPKEWRYGKTNPSTKVFQALRIEVNKELDVLSESIDQLIPLLKIGGRLAIITFHSLEDRIVKNKFKEYLENEVMPVEILTKKPILPTESEILENSRSRSAKLRVIERIAKRKSKNKYKQE